MKHRYAIVRYQDSKLKGILSDNKLLHPTKEGLCLTLGADTTIIKTFKTKKELMEY